MKLNKISFSLLAIALLVSMQSCKKYLEQAPDNRAEINTVEKFISIDYNGLPRT